ncbi:sigma-70 family RNA polymerase sigma factor [Nocardia aurea]|uniref:Sigma-70 family RNA polymerase sigma factor n=1 Tax=Nocardia aurea TaxID=2144174 RepID=A0ABV3FSE1_9NOCA
MHTTTTTDVITEPDSAPGQIQRETAAYVAEFQDVRPRLFGIAYRMLGRATDAEDVVQDVWLRWQGTDRAMVRDNIAYLVTITTRVTLNAAGSASARREVPVDSRLPGQVATAEDPSSVIERSVDLEHAVALLLQRLTPTERAVFVLREAFDYPFRDIADRLGISEANARQLARRARTHLAAPRDEPVQRAARDRLLRAFVDATRNGPVARLERLLAEDVTAHSARGRQRESSPGTGIRAVPSRNPRAARSLVL